MLPALTDYLSLWHFVIQEDYSRILFFSVCFGKRKKKTREKIYFDILKNCVKQKQIESQSNKNDCFSLRVKFVMSLRVVLY